MRLVSFENAFSHIISIMSLYFKCSILYSVYKGLYCCVVCVDSMYEYVSSIAKVGTGFLVPESKIYLFFGEVDKI